jgi:hypothetical protein
LYGGVLWLDKSYQVDTDTKSLVLGLPIDIDDPKKAIKNKDAVHEEVYAKYGTHRGLRGVVIAEIHDHKV